jgi:TPR repeat protein
MNIRYVLYGVAFIFSSTVLHATDGGARRIDNRAYALTPDELADYIADAEEGDVAAMYHLGVYYQHCLTPPLFGRALHWYRQAAEREHANAYVRLGLIYEVLINNPEPFDNYREAAAAYERAIELDPHNSNAHYLLAALHEDHFVPEWGQNVRAQKRMNKERVTRLYWAANRLGDPRARFRLASLANKGWICCCLCRIFCPEQLEVGSFLAHGML